MSFVPIDRMRDRLSRGRAESDTEYYFELLYLGELLLKLIVVELVAGLEDDRDASREKLLSRLVRADGIGEWAEVLDQALLGPPSQYLVLAARDSQRALSQDQPPASQTWQRIAVDRLNGCCRRLDGAHPDLSQRKASLRDWMTEFVWLRNRTRGHGAPHGGTLSKLCEDLHESIAAILGSAPIFNRAWAHLHRNLSGKYRVTSFGGDREPFEYLTREDSHSLADGCYVYFDRPRLVPLLYTDPALSDFSLANGGFTGGRFKTLSYITGEERSEYDAQWNLPLPDSEPPSETAAGRHFEVIGNAFSNMPSRQEGYVNRPALEVELLTVLGDDKHPVVSLMGRGGTGKTSVALEVLHRISEGSQFFAIVWFSARDIDLLSSGPKIVRPDVLSVDDIARDFGRLMDMPQRSKEAERRFFTDCLCGQEEIGPILFVFDNFETLRDPGEVYRYLENAARVPNKVLITTRARDFRADWPIEVSGMKPDEFEALTIDVAERLQIRSIVTKERTRELFEEADGHPYIAKVLLGEVAKEGKWVSLTRIVAAKDRMLEALFDRSYSALTPAAQRVFLTLCRWQSALPKIGLEAVLLRPANQRLDVEKALVDLEKASLVEVKTGASEKELFLSVPGAARQFGRRKIETSPSKMMIEADVEILHDFGAARTADVIQRLDHRVDHLARRVAARLDQGRTITDELFVLEYIASEYPRAWLALAELHQDDLTRSASYVSRYLEATPGDQAAWDKLIRLKMALKDPWGEMHARLAQCEISSGEFAQLSQAVNRLNLLLTLNGLSLDQDARRLMVARLRKLMEERKTEADATDLSRLAWLCLHDHDPASAEMYVKEGLAQEPQNRHCRQLLERLSG